MRVPQAVGSRSNKSPANIIVKTYQGYRQQQEFPINTNVNGYQGYRQKREFPTNINVNVNGYQGKYISYAIIGVVFSFCIAIGVDSEIVFKATVRCSNLLPVRSVMVTSMVSTTNSFSLSVMLGLILSEKVSLGSLAIRSSFSCTETVNRPGTTVP